jgi:hypothetical protein
MYACTSRYVVSALSSVEEDILIYEFVVEN